jgi:hypothetical protein
VSSVPGRILIHASHHKCGTRWVHSICREISEIVGHKWTVVSNPSQFDYDITTFCQKNEVTFLSDVNSHYSYIESLHLDYLGFHVIRDPRDILVSSYFSSLKTHSSTNWPELEVHRRKLEGLTKDEGLLLEMEFINDVFESLRDWNYKDERILEVRIEDLMRDNYSAFIRIGIHLGLINENDESTSSIAIQTNNYLRLVRNRLAARSRALGWLALYPEKIPVLNLLGIIYRNRFAAKSEGRNPGNEDHGSHYRKGVAGDWRNHLTPLVESEFKAKWGDLVVKMGYETSSDWSFEKTD